MIDEILTIPDRPQQVYEDFWAKVRKASGLVGIKKQLLDLNEKPLYGTVLYQAMFRYSRGKCYDPMIDVEMTKRGWINPNSDEEIKQQILNLAKSGADKPTHRNRDTYAYYLAKFCRKNKNNDHYDPEFDKKIRKLRPDWFDKTFKTKQKLMDLAASGAKRPKTGTPMGRALYKYCNSKDFDINVRNHIKNVSSWCLI